MKANRCTTALAFWLFFVSCGSVTPVPRYTASEGQEGVVSELKKRKRHGKNLLEVVESYLGVPYQWGGTTRAGMDCSAITRAIVRETYGIELPRTSKQMFAVGKIVANKNLKPGDIVFFKNTYSGPGVSHVGIFLGDGRFAHASASRGVTITELSHSYFSKRYVGARRVTR